MKIDRKFFFRAATILLLLLIAVLMFIVGRGHKVYFDNKVYSQDGVEFATPYKVEVYVKGNDVQKLYTRERGESVIKGQKLKVKLDITDKKGGSERTESYVIRIPYSLDGAVINLPALLNGLGEDKYLTEFVSLAITSEAKDEEVVLTDDFSMSGM